MTNSQYKSPTHKLITFFNNSRDQWKAKTQSAKRKIRSLIEMLRKLRQRRDFLQGDVKERRQQVKELEKQLETVANKPEKKRAAIIREQNSNQADRSLVPINQNEDARIISMATEFITTACLSFRGAGKSLKIIEKYLPMDTPCADSIRQWVYRFGYYELIERKKAIRSDWVFIADFTANIGTHKCFIILGIALKKLKQCKWHLTHQDVTLLGLELWEHVEKRSINVWIKLVVK